MRDQAVAASYVAGQASGRAEAASGLYMAVVDDLKGIRVQQNLHTVTLAQHSKILDGLATTVHEHTRTLEEHTKKLDGLTTRVDGLTATVGGLTTTVDGLATTVGGHTKKLDEQGTKLDEILDIVRTLK
ncbi:hypothetical protein AB0M95_12755 [Sphaerisporangium sp. NPDC051017]|uniref:hypothetical protein n=1 Tax=Sphaerisporangium sp. NPDC051017 TaxID=3154636 RepID=UPI00343170F2